jgi:O-antigen ligase
MTAVSGASSVAGADVTTGRWNRLVGTAQGRLTIVRDPLRMVLFILTVITISRVHQHYPVLAKFRLAVLLVIAAVGYAYLNPRYLTRANVLRLWPMRLVAALGAWACCSAAFGISLGGSAAFILDTYAKTLAYAFMIAVSIRHVRDLFTFVWAYVVSCGILAFFSLFVFGMDWSEATHSVRLNDLYTYDSNDLGVVMMVGLPLTLLLFTVVRGTKRLFLLLVLIGIAATMAHSGSRGGFLGFVAVGCAALILVDAVSPARRILVFATLAIALAIGAPYGYWKQMATILSPKDDYNFTEIDGRKAVMERGIGYMKQHPAFGLGIHNFARAECTISPKLAALRINRGIKCSAPHNSYLEAGAELGVPGGLVFGSLVIGLILGPLRLRRRLPNSWRRGTESERFIYGATSFFAVAMVGFAVTSSFVSFAWIDPVYVMAGLLTGLYVATRVELEKGLSGENTTAARAASPSRAGGWRVARRGGRSQVGQLDQRTRQ